MLAMADVAAMAAAAATPAVIFVAAIATAIAE
jgi:hypothetical protein